MNRIYYHVFVEVKNSSRDSGNLELYEFDFEDKETIIEDILFPYILKKEFQFNGCFLNSKDIVRLLVKKSDKPIDEIVKSIEESMDPGIIWMVTRSNAFSDNDYSSDITRIIIKEANTKSRLTEIDEKSVINPASTIDYKKVFIVHGHDEIAKVSVARLLERLDLKPIILHEQASGGTTILEKIEKYSDVGYGIVLYTPCDLGMTTTETELKMRARQNVIFEHGYLIAKLGRSKVCAMVKGNIEKPNDISGVVYINFDEGNGWHGELVKELKSAGFKVDANKLYTQ